MPSATGRGAFFLGQGNKNAKVRNRTYLSVAISLITLYHIYLYTNTNKALDLGGLKDSRIH